MTDITALSYWFPKLEAAGLPVPKTIIMTMPEDAENDVWEAFDGKDGSGALLRFAGQIGDAAKRIGSPFFLRTDHTSAKHNWDKTCFVSDQASIAGHILSIAEYSEMCGFIGLPWSTWVVREMLPTIPYGVCPRFGNMPICKEFRFFVDDDRIKCFHPYWPMEALERGGADGSIDFEALCRTDDLDVLRSLASAAGRAVGGAWSVDILETERGWFVTDMAEAHKSYHWEGCTA